MSETVEISKDETPQFLFEMFQEEEDGAVIDLTGAAITAESNLPSLPDRSTNEAEGQITVDFDDDLVEAMQVGKLYFYKVVAKDGTGRTIAKAMMNLRVTP